MSLDEQRAVLERERRVALREIQVVHLRKARARLRSRVQTRERAVLVEEDKIARLGRFVAVVADARRSAVSRRTRVEHQGVVAIVHLDPTLDAGRLRSRRTPENDDLVGCRTRIGRTALAEKNRVLSSRRVRPLNGGVPQRQPLRIPPLVVRDEHRFGLRGRDRRVRDEYAQPDGLARRPGIGLLPQVEGPGAGPGGGDAAARHGGDDVAVTAGSFAADARHPSCCPVWRP